jgi:hypothetical protein
MCEANYIYAWWLPKLTASWNKVIILFLFDGLKGCEFYLVAQASAIYD